MAAEATAVFHAGCQSGVGLVRVVVDVTGKATAAPVTRHVDCMLTFRLSQMAACALLAQHRVRNAVAQRLEIRAITRVRSIVENGARSVNDSAAGLHQVSRNTRYTIGMAAATGTFCRCQVAWERDHSLVRESLCRYLRVASMTGDTVLGRESVGRIETALLRGVALQAAVGAC